MIELHLVPEKKDHANYRLVQKFIMVYQLILETHFIAEMTIATLLFNRNIATRIRRKYHHVF